MKKMVNGSIKCDVMVLPEFEFYSQVPCEYEKDTISYAVEKFYAHSTLYCSECTVTSWRMRLEKGKKNKKTRCVHLVPTTLLELPGGCARITVEIDPAGVKVKKVELLKMLSSKKINFI